MCISIAETRRGCRSCVVSLRRDRPPRFILFEVDANGAPSDVLVLGGGGILGEAWMNGVLAGLELESEFDANACAGYVGTSAGSIVATALAAGVSVDSRLGRLPEQPALDDDSGESAPGGL